jgi:hypothetical protein
MRGRIVKLTRCRFSLQPERKLTRTGTGFAHGKDIILASYDCGRVKSAQTVGNMWVLRFSSLCLTGQVGAFRKRVQPLSIKLCEESFWSYEGCRLATPVTRG